MKLTAPISASYVQDIGFSVAFQMLVFVLVSLGTVTGQMLMWVLYSLAIYWVMTFIMIARRPRSPTRVDLIVIRYGFFVILAAVIGSTTVSWTLSGVYAF